MVLAYNAKSVAKSAGSFHLQGRRLGLVQNRCALGSLSTRQLWNPLPTEHNKEGGQAAAAHELSDPGSLSSPSPARVRGPQWNLLSAGLPWESRQSEPRLYLPHDHGKTHHHLLGFRGYAVSRSIWRATLSDRHGVGATRVTCFFKKGLT